MNHHPAIHLRSVRLRDDEARGEGFPFSLPLVRGLGELRFESPVTILIGDNGSGKSTLLEALACAVGSITVGSESVRTDPTLAAQRRLARALKLTWNRKPTRGFFLRAEDFFAYAQGVNEMREAHAREIAAIDEEYRGAGRSGTAAGLAKMPHARELHDLQRHYGDGLDAQSHGESFMALFRKRLVPRGLYLLDEPEAPLSPTRQLALLAMIQQEVARDSQFIIATHAPILMALPGATILSLDGGAPRPIPFDEIEHVRLLRDFLADPARFLRHL